MASSVQDHQSTGLSDVGFTAHHGHNHGHSHDHDHAHQRSGNLNAEVFDRRVASPETSTRPEWQRYYEAFSVELVERRAWMGLTRPPAKDHQQPGGDGAAGDRPVRLLDYACGGGHASRTLLPYIDRAVGVDVSGRSVAVYNEWAAANGAADSIRALQANVMTDEGRRALAGDEYFGFDLAVCLMALHHFADAQLAINRLVERLRPGGSLVVVDWNQDGCTLWPKDVKHEASHTVHAVGFGEVEMRRLFEAAGLENYDYQEVHSYTEAGITAMSRGTKPVEK